MKICNEMAVQINFPIVRFTTTIIQIKYRFVSYNRRKISFSTKSTPQQKPRSAVQYRLVTYPWRRFPNCTSHGPRKNSTPLPNLVTDY